MNAQRILVIGPDAFVGRQLVRTLAATPWATPVAAVAKRSVTATSIEQVLVDPTDPAQWAIALRGIDGVANCVADDSPVLLETTRALFDAAKSLGTPRPRIVHVSSMAVYGSTVGTIDETAPVRGDIGPYSVARIEAEAASHGYADTVLLRPGSIYGDGSPQWTRRIASWLKAGRVGDLGSHGDGWCNLVHVEDVVQAITRALRVPDAGGATFNLSMVDPPTWNDYFVAFAKALRAVPVRRISTRWLKVETKVLAPPLKIAEIAAARFGLAVSPLPPPLPASLLRLWRQEIRLDPRRAEERLGLRFKPLDEGLAEAAATA